VVSRSLDVTRNSLAIIAVKVVPRAHRDEIVGWLDGALKVRVTSPPQDGRANRALEELLAAALGLKKGAVHVATGRASARKHVAVEGLERDEILRRLARTTAQ
jgi:uncharacterized protein (TIGR00251 family)